MRKVRETVALLLTLCLLVIGIPGGQVQAEGMEEKPDRVVIDVTDYGADATGAKDSAQAIQRAIETAKKEDKPVILNFPKGRYDIYPDKAAERELYISNTVGADAAYKNKKIGILLENMEHVTVEGNDSLFMFHGKMMTFAVIDCEDVVFQNFKVDFQVPTVIDLTVEKIEGNEAVVYVPECYNYRIEGTDVYWMSDESPYTGELYWEQKNALELTNRYNTKTDDKYWENGWMCPIFENVVKVEDMGNHRLKFTYSTITSEEMQEGMCFQMRQTLRDHAGAFFWKSKEVKLQNLDIYFLHAFGMVGQHSENLTFENVHFETPKESGRTNAASADFIQMSGCKGLIDIHGCTFDNPQDDPINIHGTYNQVVEKIAPNKIKVRYMHNQTAGFPNFFVGDEVEFMTKEELLPIEGVSAKVIAVDGPDGQGGDMGEGSGSLTDMILTFDKNIPDEIQPDTHVVENITYTPRVSIKNNLFRNTPTRGVLVTTRQPVVIENNIFDGMQTAGIKISNDAKDWYESGQVRDVTIRNNIFMECQGECILLDPTNTVSDAARPVHSNLTIEGNTFYLDEFNSNTKVLNIKSVDNLIFKDNRIYRPDPVKKLELSMKSGEKTMKVGDTAYLDTEFEMETFNGRLFDLNGCRNVTIENNTYDGGLNTGISISNMSPTDITVQNDIAAVNEDNRTSTVDKIVYESSDEEVLKAFNDGMLIAVGEGNATVKACLISGGRKFETVGMEFVVTKEEIGKAPDDIVIDAETEITEMEQVKYTAKLTGGDESNRTVYWSVADAKTGGNTQKAVIDENGLLTPKQPGIVEVIARTVNGLEARKLLVMQQRGYELSDEYEVLYPNPSTMEISGKDKITLKTYGMGLWAHLTTNNIVVTDQGKENVTAIVKMQGMTRDGYEEAGLVFYKDDDNYTAIQRKHANGNPGIIVVNESLQNPTEQGNSYTDEQDIYLKLEKTGEKIVGFYSTDKVNWVKVREVTNSTLGNEFKIGLLVGRGAGNTERPFTFSEMEIDGQHIPFTKESKIPTAHEPRLEYFEDENKIQAEFETENGTETLVKWAISDTEDGTFRLIEDMEGREIISTPWMKGKYVRAAIIPYTEGDICGEIVWTPEIFVTGDGENPDQEKLLSGNAYLKTASINGVQGFDEFNKYNLYYYATAGTQDERVDFQFETESEEADLQIIVNGEKIYSREGTLELQSGRNVVNVIVTAQDQVTVRNYWFTISRTSECNTDLASLSVNEEEIALENDKTQYRYDAENLSEAFVEARAVNPKAAVTLVKDGKTLDDGKVTLKPGANEVVILVTTKTSGAPNRYTLNMKVPDKANAHLESVQFDENVLLNESFDRENTEYTGTATKGKIKIVVQAEEKDAELQILRNDKVQSSGKGAVSTELAIQTGENIIKIRVTSSDGTDKKEYLFQLTGAGIVYLSNLDWETNSTTGWGTLNKDKEAGGAPIILKDENGHNVQFEKGIGAHADSDVYYNLEGKEYKKFETYVGVDVSQNGNGSVTFEVLIDGVSYFKSQEMTSSDVMQKIAVEIPKEAKTLQLRATKGADNACDHANWADAKFIKDLEEIQEETLSTEVLKYAIDLAKSADTEGVIDSVKTAFEQALADAEQMLADAGAGVSRITQTDVDTCWQNLIKAMQYLSFKQGDKTDLEKVAALAADMEVRLDFYLDDGKQAFTDALAAAREILEDGDAMQEEVNQSWRDLLEAMANLRLKPDKSALETLIHEASALSENAYEAESFSVMRTALAKAQKVSADENADQKEVTAAEESLKDAVAKLEPLSEGAKSGEQDTVKAVTDNHADASGTAANTDNTAADNITKSAKTGDAANPMAAAAVMAAMAVILLNRRKKILEFFDRK